MAGFSLYEQMTPKTILHVFNHNRSQWIDCDVGTLNTIDNLLEYSKVFGNFHMNIQEYNLIWVDVKAEDVQAERMI